MSKILILIINFYQNYISVILKNILGVNKMCKFFPTCSEYTRTAISQEGVFAGLKKSTIRILKCQSFFN